MCQNVFEREGFALDCYSLVLVDLPLALLFPALEPLAGLGDDVIEGLLVALKLGPIPTRTPPPTFGPADA